MRSALTAGGIDVDAVSRWLAHEGHISTPITEVTVLAGGTQNLLLRLSAGSNAFVLRKPPSHDGRRAREVVQRESAVLRALTGTAVPHPAFVAAALGPGLGGPFYVMEAIDGWNVADGLPAWFATTESRDELAESLAESVGELASMDPFTAGLGSLARRTDGWVAGQLGRWQGKLASYRDIDGYGIERLPGTDGIERWLRAHRPTVVRLGLVHGDLHLANIMLHHTEPRVAAIVDWELVGIGDPLLDLGHLLVTWPGSGGGSLEVPGGEHLPARERVVDAYVRATGRDLCDLPWFEVLAAYRLAVILEGAKARGNVGLADEKLGDRLHGLAVALMHRAVCWSS